MDAPSRHVFGHARLDAWYAAALSLFCLGGTALPAAAQGPLSVEVSPLRVELKMAPGATHTQPVTLRNDSAAGVHVRVRVDEYWLSRDGTPQFKLAAPNEPFSAVAWVKTNPTELTLAPGATGTVRVTTTAPAGTMEGGYRCAVMFEFDPPGMDAKTARKDMQFRGRVATIVYATIGNPASSVELTDLQVRPGLSAGAPLDVVAVLKNTSRAYVRTKGTLTISTEGGRSLRVLQIPSVPVLPNTEREVRIATAAENDARLDPGRYKVEVRIDVGQPALIVGETTMEVSK